MGTPRHAHSPLSSPGLPLHIHTPCRAGLLIAGGRERVREELLGVPGRVGEGQHVTGRCGLTAGVRDVSGLWMYSMRCVRKGIRVR